MTDNKHPHLIEVIDQSILEEWKVTVDNAARLYHGDEVALPPNMVQHANLVRQLAEYLTVHEIDFVTDPENPQADEVDEEILARMYHFLRWQSMKYDIWIK